MSDSELKMVIEALENISVDVPQDAWLKFYAARGKSLQETPVDNAVFKALSHLPTVMQFKPDWENFLDKYELDSIDELVKDHLQDNTTTDAKSDWDAFSSMLDKQEATELDDYVRESLNSIHGSYSEEAWARLQLFLQNRIRAKVYLWSSRILEVAAMLLILWMLLPRLHHLDTTSEVPLDEYAIDNSTDIREESNTSEAERKILEIQDPNADKLSEVGHTQKSVKMELAFSSTEQEPNSTRAEQQIAESHDTGTVGSRATKSGLSGSERQEARAFASSDQKRSHTESPYLEKSIKSPQHSQNTASSEILGIQALSMIKISQVSPLDPAYKVALSKQEKRTQSTLLDTESHSVAGKLNPDAPGNNSAQFNTTKDERKNNATAVFTKHNSTEGYSTDFLPEITPELSTGHGLKLVSASTQVSEGLKIHTGSHPGAFYLYYNQRLDIISTPYDPFYDVAPVRSIQPGNGIGIAYYHFINHKFALGLGLEYNSYAYIPPQISETYGSLRQGINSVSLREISFREITMPLEVQYTAIALKNWSFGISTGVNIHAIVSAAYDIQQKRLGTSLMEIYGQPAPHGTDFQESELSNKAFFQGLLKGGGPKEGLYTSIFIGLDTRYQLTGMLALHFKVQYQNFMGFDGVGPNKDILDAINFKAGIGYSI